MLYKYIGWRLFNGSGSITKEKVITCVIMFMLIERGFFFLFLFLFFFFYMGCLHLKLDDLISFFRIWD